MGVTVVGDGSDIDRRLSAHPQSLVLACLGSSPALSKSPYERRVPAVVVIWLEVSELLRITWPSGASGSCWTLVLILLVVPLVGAFLYTLFVDGPRSLRGLGGRH